MKRRKNKHHCVPRSRGGKTDSTNLLEKDVKKHEAYHTIFDNATPEEAIAIIIMEWTTPEWRDRFVKDQERRLERLERLIIPHTR
ncbi:MAG TPA: hypothetical protein PLE33_06035 [Candidatus Cloacimonas sp.]|nr:hypothetical protein [Candidatus Cloacimonas sp.]HPS60805.1 hypothetical protein [Candidatus Cloacimonas sp.]